MSVVQISAMLGQWAGAAICMVAVVISVKGIEIEQKYQAHKGFRHITKGSVIAALGCFIFAIATKFLGF